jgi:hypothetical protein
VLSAFELLATRIRQSLIGALGRNVLGGGVVSFLSTIVSWLRAGYPDGVPENDYLPILALLSRKLTADEVIEVARQLKHVPEPEFADIGVEILRITDQLPSPADVERVREKLAAYGWPLDDPRDSAETNSKDAG